MMQRLNVEFWGRSVPEGTYKFSLDDGKMGKINGGATEWCDFAVNARLTSAAAVQYGLNNTYKALRIVGKKYNIYYSVWCTNEHELYDLIASLDCDNLLIKAIDLHDKTDPH